MLRHVNSLLLLLLPLMLSAQVPDFTVTDTDGNPHRLYDYLDSNQFVVLDFFFTNCSFCQYYAPQVQQSYIDFGCNLGNTFFLGIDYGDSTQAVIDFHQTYGTDYPAASGIEGGGDSVIALYGVTGYPTLMLISPQRQLLKVITSPTTNLVDTILMLSGCQLMPCDAALPRPGFETTTRIHPNPIRAGGTITIDGLFATEGSITVELNSIAGINVGSAVLPPGKREYTIPPNLPAGIYILQLIAEGKRSSINLSITR